MATAKATGAVAKAGASAVKGAVKMATGGGSSSTGSSSTGGASTKDRTGFDMSQLKSSGGSSTGEIKQA
jgi:hypothetical protein